MGGDEAAAKSVAEENVITIDRASLESTADVSTGAAGACEALRMVTARLVF